MHVSQPRRVTELGMSTNHFSDHHLLAKVSMDYLIFIVIDRMSAFVNSTLGLVGPHDPGLICIFNPIRAQATLHCTLFIYLIMQGHQVNELFHTLTHTD